MICRKITKKDIKIKPWKPKLGDIYYAVTLFNTCSIWTWTDSPFDEQLYRDGLVCKSIEEAEEVREYLLRKVREYRKWII